MIYKTTLGELVWHGPISKGHHNCLEVGSGNGLETDLSKCKEECLKVGCNTLSFNESKMNCVFHQCEPSMLSYPEFDLRSNNMTTYVYLGINYKYLLKSIFWM